MDRTLPINVFFQTNQVRLLSDLGMLHYELSHEHFNPKSYSARYRHRRPYVFLLSCAIDVALLRFLTVCENCGSSAGFESVCVANVIARNFVTSLFEE